MYTIEEKINMYQWYKKNSLRKVRELFMIHYPSRPLPSIATIHKFIQKFNSEASEGLVVNCYKQGRENCPILNELLSEENIDSICRTCLVRNTKETMTSIFDHLEYFEDDERHAIPIFELLADVSTIKAN